MPRADETFNQAPSEVSARTPEGMGGLGKGLAIIEAFGDSHHSLSVSNAAKISGVSRASARRCLLTLTERGYLIKEGAHFTPTPRMLRLSAAYFETVPLPQLAQTHLENARNEIKESIALAVLDEGYSTFIARAESERIVSSVAKIGRRLPAFACATGRVLLSGKTSDELDQYLNGINPVANTSQTVVDKAELKALIINAGEINMAFTSNELEEGMISIAVPVVNSKGEIVAAMSMSASSARITVEKMCHGFLSVLQQNAQALSLTL